MSKKIKADQFEATTGKVDPDAIHGDAAAEISVVPAKGVPVAADLVLIEDSDDANNKKRVQLGNLPGTGAADALSTTGSDVDVAAAAPPSTGQVLKATSPTAATWQAEAGGGAADALSTTGADVDVAAEAPPTAGQVLKATGATAATWQDAQVLASAQGDYIHVRLGATMLSPVALEPVEYDTILVQRGDLAYDAVNFKFTGLKAGRTYRLYANTSVITDSIDIQWWDLTAGAYLGAMGRSIAINEVNNNSSTPVVEAIFTPTQDTEVEVRMRAVGGSPDIQLSLTSASIQEIGAVQANVIGGLEFMDIINVDSPTSLVSFGASGDGLLQRAMDGDADETYVIEFRLANTGVNDVSLRPNGATTNQEGARGTLGSSLTYFSYLIICEPTSAGDEEEGSLEFYAARTRGGVAQPRTYRSSSGLWDTTTSNVLPRGCSGRWDETVTNITSMDIAVEGGGSEIAAGSYFTLYRRTRNNVRADSASTYERNVEATVAQGTNAEVEYTTGHATYQGSAIGLSISLNDTVTVGTVTVNLKVGGSTVLTAVLDATNNPVFNRDVEAIGVHKVAAGDTIEVGIATSTLTTTGAGTPGITVNVTLVNDAMLAATTGLLDSTNLYSKAQTVATEDLGNISGATAIDATLSNTYKAVATAAAVIGAPSDMEDGWTVVLRIRQGGAGSFAVTFDSVWDWGDDGAPDTSADATDTLLLVSGSSDGTNVFASWKKGFTNT